MSATTPTEWAIKNLAPLPHKNADSPQRIQWVRGKIRLYVWTVACLDLAGVANEWLDAPEQATHASEAEAIMAGTGTATQAGLPYADGWAAGKAEYAAAQTRAREFVDQLRRATFPMARAKTPGAAIMAAAHQVNDRFDNALSTELLTTAVRVIAHNALPSKGRRHGVR